MTIPCKKCKMKTLYDDTRDGWCLQCIWEKMKRLEKQIKKLTKENQAFRSASLR